MSSRRLIRLVPIRNYIALKLESGTEITEDGLVPIRNYIALKLIVTPSDCSFSLVPIRNYIALKRRDTS